MEVFPLTNEGKFEQPLKLLADCDHPQRLAFCRALQFTQLHRRLQPLIQSFEGSREAQARNHWEVWKECGYIMCHL